MAELEAVEHLLARGERPRRGVILAFGEDEEVDSHGATALAALLAERGVRAAFLLDEGTTTMADGAAWGAPGCVISDVCLSQKGYANVRLTARGQGGHSSNPFGGTSLERLCRAVARLCDTKPAPQLTDVMRQTFRASRQRASSGSRARPWATPRSRSSFSTQLRPAGRTAPRGWATRSSGRP